MKNIKSLIIVVIIIGAICFFSYKYFVVEKNENIAHDIAFEVYNDVLNYYSSMLSIDRFFVDKLDLTKDTIQDKYQIEKGYARMNEIGLFEFVMYYKGYCSRKKYSDDIFSTKKTRIEECEL